MPLAGVASVHVDDADAEADGARPPRAIIAADLGDAAAQDAVDDAEGFELSLVRHQEIGALLDLALTRS